MNQEWLLVGGWIILSSLAGFLLMGFDKHRARGWGRRVPERTFFALALAGGAFGILAGSSVFRHKTLKGSFMGVIILSAVLWVAALAELARLLGPPFS